MGSLAAETCSRTCLRSHLRLAPPLTRTFTSSSPRRKDEPIPSFTPTSSPDLDALLSTFRTNVFLPSRLLQAQRAFIYRTTKQSILTGDDPVTVSIGDEEFTLKPLNHLTDEPPFRRSFFRILDMMQEKRDWDNLPGFFEGAKMSGRKLKSYMAEKFVRRAAEMGRQGVVMRCVMDPERTGVKLDTKGVAREVVWGARKIAVDSEWSEEGVERALRYAEKVLELLEDERHIAGGEKGVTVRRKDDPRFAPEVLGAVLELVARKALMGEGSKDGHGKVERYAQRMMDMWGNTKIGLDDEQQWYAANDQLVMWTPVVNGMRMAVQCLGESSALGERVSTTLAQEVEPVVRKAREMVMAAAPPGRDRRGLTVYASI